MDSTSEDMVTSSSSGERNSNSDSNLFKASSSDSLEEGNSGAYPKTSDGHPVLEVDEDHFSINSDIDFLDDLDVRVSNLNREEQIELAISKFTTQLRGLSSSDLNNVDKEEKRKQIVKKICDLKVKLARLKEQEEFADALREQVSTGEDCDISSDNLILFKRVYTYSKSVGGHRLVLSSDIFENEKRLRSVWKSFARQQAQLSPISMSPSTTSCGSLLSQSLPCGSGLLQMLTSNSHLSYLTGAISGNWTTGYTTTTPPTNPLQQLVCDQCLKRSSKSINDYLLEAFKFSKKSELSQSVEVKPSNNPFLVCIYCFFTIHLNCLTRVIRKCPKLFFDDISNDLVSDQYSRFYNLQTGEGRRESSLSNSPLMPIGVVDSHQRRMKRIILKISPELGLSKQDFRCAECRIPISPSPPKENPKMVSKPRLCDYTGLYFCENCHIGDTAVIPARVIHNWDFQPQPVSRASLQIISYLKNRSFHYDRPVLINLVEINSMLYGLVDELIQIKRLRNELAHIYKYISLCKQPSKPRQWIAIMCQLGSHLLNEQEINYLSFSDICDLKALSTNLSELEALFITHITTCESCRGKGFYCELCPNKEDILFPFSPNTTTCTKCNAVYHKNCYYRRNRLCPRCNRIKDKTIHRQQMEQFSMDEDSCPGSETDTY